MIGLHRNIIDKYYTKITIVDICINLFKQFVQFEQNDLIIEPSAGNGAFIFSIKQLSNNYKFYDLEPDHDEIIKQDYLLLDYNKFSNNNIHILGNPPFGRQSSIAIKFIKKSCEFANTISFILPKSFKKDSLKNAFLLKFHLIHEVDLPNNSFLVNNKEYNVPCIFQIWEKKLIDRVVISKLIPINFEFVHKSDDPHISFRRVGGNAGKIDKKILDKNI